MTKSNLSQKKLKAIVFTDMADFTKISAQDEQKALDLIQKQNEIIKPIVEKHKGEWLKEIGDGLLFSFDSSLEAVRCTIEIQETLKEIEDLNIRIGIHQGDIFIKDGDVFGDDVNVTSRIESFSPIGGICVSDKVYEDISSTPEIKSEYIGYKRLKGIQQEIKLRCIYSNTIPKQKTNKLPYYSGLFINFFGYIGIIMSLFIFIYNIIPNNGKINNIMFLWFPVNNFQLLVFGISLICIGNSNIAFIRGISYKSQRNIVYLGYLIVITIIIVITYLGITGMEDGRMFKSG
tara:strand:+ start:15 stop:884 length:870 start_codon:yes stop_codon:yes gene_type:complete